jgi:hypothetical protein
METEIIHCENWNDFKRQVLERLFGSDPFRRGIFLFRGQRDSEWALKSSYDRWFETTNMPESRRVPVAEELLTQFKTDIAGLSAYAGIDDRSQILALAQHHELPTRLLDWSQSPYIAAFFAFAGALETDPSHGSIAVVALDTRNYAWTGRGVTLLNVRGNGNVRLRNQEGQFTLLESASTCLEDHTERLAAEEPWPLYKFVVPATEARLALSELDIMGINACRVYPDLQGCSLNARLTVLMKGDALARGAH